MPDITVSVKFAKDDKVFVKERLQDNTIRFIFGKIMGISLVNDPLSDGQIDGTGKKVKYEIKLYTGNPMDNKIVETYEEDLMSD
ncbi:hypothetical protein LG954_11070, partial [Bifidobacterium longum subsp. infantis]|uniref:hypothetical protein n=1 Tax=Bifidobacterium longum TaxID=216816 RepID=UPI001CFF8B60